MELIYCCPNRGCAHYDVPVRLVVPEYSHFTCRPVLFCGCGFEAGQPNTPASPHGTHQDGQCPPDSD